MHPRQPPPAQRDAIQSIFAQLLEYPSRPHVRPASLCRWPNKNHG
ncbi:MAG TPA: hypothetical protein VD994_05005 [Prosthecobacter sp.]|nr:hypothetical protein [Prosthecobacter sp.]